MHCLQADTCPSLAFYHADAGLLHCTVFMSDQTFGTIMFVLVYVFLYLYLYNLVFLFTAHCIVLMSDQTCATIYGLCV